MNLLIRFENTVRNAVNKTRKQLEKPSNPFLQNGEVTKYHCDVFEFSTGKKYSSAEEQGNPINSIPPVDRETILKAAAKLKHDHWIVNRIKRVFGVLNQLALLAWLKIKLTGKVIIKGAS